MRFFNLLKHDFVKSVTVLMTGTVLAQVIAFLISPVLTRIYTPEEMGDLNVYIRVVAFLSAFATARFELSLPLPKKDEHSYLLYRLSLKIASYMLSGIILFFSVYFLFSLPDAFSIIFAVATVLGTVFLVLTNLGTNWSIRKKQFRKISISRVVNSGSSNVLRWIFGIWGWGSIGLIGATVIGYILSSLSFVKEWFKINKEYTSFRSGKKTRALVVAYREFPSVNLPHVLVDLGKDLLLAFFIIFYFSKDVFAWYSHSYAVLQLPISIIGISIGQVFFNRCAEIVNNGGSTLPILRKTVVMLFSVSIVPFIILFFFGTPLFAFVFGENWANAGYYSEIMTVWFMMNFLNSAVSSLPTILHRQKQFFILGIISAAIQLFGFGILPLLLGSTESAFPTILWFVSGVQAVFFVYVLIVMFRFARAGVK